MKRNVVYSWNDSAKTVFSAKTNTNKSMRPITNYPQWGYKNFKQIFDATLSLRDLFAVEIILAF